MNFPEFSSAMISLLGQQMLYSGIVFLIVLSIVSIFRKIPQRWQMVLWMLVVIRLVLPPDLSFEFSGRHLLARMPVIQKSIQYVSELFHLNMEQIFPEHEGSFSLEENSGYSRPIAGSNAGNSQENSTLVQFMFLGWILGSIITSIHYLKKLAFYKVILARSKPVSNGKITDLAETIKCRFGIRRKIEIKASHQFLSPFTKGIIKPKIFLPKSIVETKDDDMLQSVLAHEIAHIKRFDDLWIKLLNIVQIVYFFNPMLWYADHKIRLSRECLCDQLALQHQKISAQRYGASILNVLKLNMNGDEKFTLLPGFGNHKKQFTIRLKNLNGGYTVKKYQNICAYALLFLFGLILLPMSGDSLRVAEPNSDAVYAAENISKLEFECPLKEGRVSAKFGKILHPYSGKEYDHIGIDIAAAEGTGIYAAESGIVGQVKNEFEENKGPGKLLLIDHGDGFKTRYTHLGEILVQDGETVSKGVLIARVGSTGLSTGPHLHFEIRLNDEPVDPERYIDTSHLGR